jgi:uncharacterized membrane protein
MFTEVFFDIAAVAATMLVSLSTGITYTFALLVMRGNAGLSDDMFILSFQKIDGIIQDNDGLFIFTWAGSILAVGLALISGLGAGSGPARILLIAAAALYYLGFQLPTFAINIPLNNAIQRIDVAAADVDTLARARRKFERRWNRANRFRSMTGVLTMALLMIVLAS